MLSWSDMTARLQYRYTLTPKVTHLGFHDTAVNTGSTPGPTAHCHWTPLTHVQSDCHSMPIFPLSPCDRAILVS